MWWGNAEDSSKLRKDTEQLLPPSPQKEPARPTPWSPASSRHWSIDVLLFDPPSWWYFVMAASSLIYGTFISKKSFVYEHVYGVLASARSTQLVLGLIEPWQHPKCRQLASQGSTWGTQDLEKLKCFHGHIGGEQSKVSNPHCSTEGSCAELGWGLLSIPHTIQCVCCTLPANTNKQNKKRWDLSWKLVRNLHSPLAIPFTASGQQGWVFTTCGPLWGHNGIFHCIFCGLGYGRYY